MQHMISSYREEDVENKATTANLLRRDRQSVDIVIGVLAWRWVLAALSSLPEDGELTEDWEEPNDRKKRTRD